MKLAAIEVMSETHPAPAPFTLIGFRDQEAHEIHYAVEVPCVMGLIGTRSLTITIRGIKDLVDAAADKIRSGLIAYDALITIRKQRGDTPIEVRNTFEEHSADLGFAMPLRQYVDDPREATDAQIAAASNDTIPGVAPLFWAFRLMEAWGSALSQ